MTNGIVVRPLRFSADVEAMRRFLELLGLRSRIESERGGWIDMVAGAGMVALHDSATSDTGASAGETTLSFEADDVDELAERLRAEGHDDATVWDEAYGRVLRVDGPGGVSVWVDERSDDLYGYRLHKAEPDDRWSVRPLLATDDADGWRELLHHLDAGLVEIAPGPYDVQLGFGTTEELDVVAARLADAGFAVEPGDGRFVVRDPDGCLVRVLG
ncbi:VOC family protein [Kribbella sp. NBC_01245]|uniref:VOC family protein n=1 Tax=Kribbella sp. NBC_01245 TaxID=2903578 RepID=UPI002E2862D8|nr:VOC family protein [Kribbella sp. NBC_01245]